MAKSLLILDIGPIKFPDHSYDHASGTAVDRSGQSEGAVAKPRPGSAGGRRGPAVADCFKYRNKIGLDVALEALRDAWQKKRMSSEDVWRYAKVCRVANVMRPYLEGKA